MKSHGQMLLTQHSSGANTKQQKCERQRMTVYFLFYGPLLSKTSP